ncbi:disks large homolog 5-like [Chionomys nivalis]|uniref:disks large homolog 5-like n=1 Tax=Chionomys nivalis TaxID=269649 RepID=UPI0025914AC4|nr:disks large homolog 5-like [Chionomys nivalis]
MFSRLRGLIRRADGERPENRERQEEADAQFGRKAGRNKWFWQRHNAAAVPSSNPRPRTQKQMQKEMERLTRELQLMTSQRNELRDHVIFITEGKVDDRPYHPPNPLNEKVKLQHRQALSALKRLEDENTEASEKLSELTKETVLYRGLHSLILMHHTHLEQKVDLLRQEKKKLRDDWALLMHHVEDLKVLCKNQEENSDVKTPQQQELKGLVERLQFLLKQKEADTQKKDSAEKLWHHFEFSQMRSKTLQPEVEEATAQDESLLQKELLQEEPPAEPHPQQLLKSGDQFYSSNLDPIVE